MQYHEGMHLFIKGLDQPALVANYMLPASGANTFFPCHQSIIGTLSPRHTRHPMQGAANYLHNHYKYL
jgi:hypothetical protein